MANGGMGLGTGDWATANGKWELIVNEIENRSIMEDGVTLGLWGFGALGLRGLGALIGTPEKKRREDMNYHSIKENNNDEMDQGGIRLYRTSVAILFPT